MAENHKLKVFVSYSRRDIAFADRLVEALKLRGFEVLIDRQDLPKLEDWERELLGFIRQADTVLLVVSPHSVGSKACAWEVEQVRTHAKRLAPVVIEDVAGASVPPEIARINYLYFTDAALFEQRADELARALNTDVDWLKEHTRLGEMARRWIEHGRPEDALIRGRDLNDANAWAGRRAREAPVVTTQHIEFLNASHLAQSERFRRRAGTDCNDPAVPEAGCLGFGRSGLITAGYACRNPLAGTGERETSSAGADRRGAERDGAGAIRARHADRTLRSTGIR